MVLREGTYPGGKQNELQVVAAAYRQFFDPLFVNRRGQRGLCSIDCRRLIGDGYFRRDARDRQNDIEVHGLP